MYFTTMTVKQIREYLSPGLFGGKLVIPSVGTYEGLFALKLDDILYMPEFKSLDVSNLTSARVCPGNGALELKYNDQVFIIMKD